MVELDRPEMESTKTTDRQPTPTPKIQVTSHARHPRAALVTMGSYKKRPIGGGSAERTGVCGLVGEMDGIDGFVPRIGDVERGPVDPYLISGLLNPVTACEPPWRLKTIQFSIRL